ncbi:saccharopine dehydrogenase family protein [Halioxenophilus sp. WMMB6]|uniref:saccharopine dehydrogenase family protein n=1 Tax=Halioxenophilus sp. WMMB6 TaxID=3073815 RepID=UPI00295E5EE8|nr:DUF5938 domain-containing protein [Halioxenophilus sp. WMMB6]
MSDPKVIVHGCGYTGKLAAEYVARRNIPFIFLGRNPEKLEASMKLIEERLGRNSGGQIAVAENTKEALLPIFEKAEVVINTVGPFMQLGGPVVEACLEGGCHYLDTTGEQDWGLLCQEKWGQAFADKGLLISPANSFMWCAGALVSEAMLETDGIDTLEIIYDIHNALPSVGSSRSFLRMVTEPQYYLEQNELVAWPKDEVFTRVVPNKPAPILTLPWSGGFEPIWFKDDHRVRTCKVLTGFGDQMMMDVVALIKQIHNESANLSAEEKERMTNDMGDDISSGEPDKDDMDVQRSYIACYGSGRQISKQLVLSLAAPYQFTGQISAQAAELLINGQLNNPGFQSAPQAFGHKVLLDKFNEMGYTDIN